MSEAVERRILAMLTGPLLCPHGNPIPGLAELGGVEDPQRAWSSQTLLSATGAQGDSTVLIERISEQLQPDEGLMRALHAANVLPGRRLEIRRCPEGVEVGDAGSPIVLNHFTAEHIFVMLDAPPLDGV